MARQALTVATALGDERAAPVQVTSDLFDAWYAELRVPLRAYLRGMTRNAGSADDLFQETWIRLLTHPPRAPDTAGVRAYVFTIATRLAIDAARRDAWIGRFFRPGRQRRDSGEVREDVLEAVEDPAATQDASFQARQDATRALRPLTPRERALVWLAHVERYDHAEIAAMLGMRPASVRVLLHRARKRAAAALRDAAPRQGGTR